MILGRERDFDCLLGHLANTDVHVVTVTGFPGVGKTHLARAALDLAPDRLFVPVAAVSGPHAIGDAVLTSLSGGNILTTSPASALWETFAGRRTVVLLDDADHAENLVQEITELIAGYPPAVLLLTAARPTGIPGERLITLRPLPVPPEDSDPDNPTVELFVQRAAEVGVSFDCSDPQIRGAVIGVCRQTGGLPLAVELAAARTATQPLRFIERTLWRQDHGDQAHRHDALRQSLRSALSTVSNNARLALAQAAQFAAPFQLDAASAVIKMPHADDTVYDALNELIDAYLLELDSDLAHDGACFTMREPVRVFAREQLDDNDLDAVRQRHVNYFRDRCWAGTDVAIREWPDIAQALDFALQHGVVDDALIVGAAAAPPLQRLAGASTRLRSQLDRLAQDEPSVGVRVDPLLRSRAIVWSTVLFPIDANDRLTVGLWTAQRLSEAIALARESGDARALLEALETTVRSINLTLDLTAATAAIHEGITLARALDDQRATARFEAWAAMEAQMRGNVSETINLATAALTHGRAHDELIAVIWASRMLLLIPEAMRPALDPPIPKLPELLAMCERAAQPYVGTMILGDLSRLALARGELTAAARWVWRQLMVAADRIRSEPLSTAYAVINTVSIALRAGDIEEAVRLRESVRSLRPLLTSYLHPQVASEYAEECAQLEQLVSPERYAQLAAETTGSALVDANRRAQDWARSRASHAEPDRTVATSGPKALLTVREREVLALLASGATNREIAADLCVSPKTVMHHSVAIYRKLGVRGRAAAAAFATRDALLGDAP